MLAMAYIYLTVLTFSTENNTINLDLRAKLSLVSPSPNQILALWSVPET